MRKRYKIFCSLSTNVSDSEAYQDIQILTTRNIPENVKEEAEVARTLEGITSRETQLSTLSFVSDVAVELERIEEESKPPIIMDERMFLPEFAEGEE